MSRQPSGRRHCHGSGKAGPHLAAPLQLLAHVLGDLMQGHVACSWGVLGLHSRGGMAVLPAVHTSSQPPRPAVLPQEAQVGGSPGPSFMTCTSFSQARRVSSPWVSSSANCAASLASATGQGGECMGRNFQARAGMRCMWALSSMQCTGSCQAKSSSPAATAQRSARQAASGTPLPCWQPGRRPSPMDSAMSYRRQMSRMSSVQGGRHQQASARALV